MNVQSRTCALPPDMFIGMSKKHGNIHLVHESSRLFVKDMEIDF